MIEWTRVVGFDWDAGNARKSADKHSVTQSEAEQAFFNAPLLVLEDVGIALQRCDFTRSVAPMKTGGCTLRSRCVAMASLVRVISARAMSARERLAYEKDP